MVTVRDADVDDATAVMTAHVAAIEAGGPAAHDDRAVAAWAERPDGAEPYRETARDDTQVFVVAERSAGVVGFGHLAPPAAREDAPDDEGEVVAMYVHDHHAGEGVGSALLGHLEERGRERGLAALELTASLNAVGFYDRHGYERVAETTHGTTGGVELDVVRMRKDLDGRR